MHANQNPELQHSFNLQMTIAVCANGLLSQVKKENSEPPGKAYTVTVHRKNIKNLQPLHN